MARLLSVNVGLPQNIDWQGRSVRTAIWKQPVQGRRMVRRLNIDGDGQADLVGHGGEQRAVMVYQMDSYHYWETHFGRNDFELGQFGENFTVEGLPDSEVCIGDRYRLGSALFEVSQPRVTCYRVGIRMGEPSMAALLVAHHRPGFYLRVLEEGEVEAGDEFTKVADGPERMTVAEIDALLYLPGHPPEQVKRALRIPPLSPGWKWSLQTLADQASTDEGASRAGNPGLAASGPPPAWSGFRALRVAKVDRESSDVISFSFAQQDGSPLPPALPGQFLVLKLRANPNFPPVLRNYSMSGPPGADTYRVSVKRESNGAGSHFLHTQVSAGDILEVSAPRGTFTLSPGDGPVVLISVGIGATPVLSMLHALASNAPGRQVWWLYGARNRDQHPFASESQKLIRSLERAQSHVVYSKPGPDDRIGLDYDSAGHLDVDLLNRVGAPRDADFFLCGPPAFLDSFSAGLKAWNAQPSRIHLELFGPGKPSPSGIAPHPPRGTPGIGPQVSFTRSGLTVQWDPSLQSLLELAEACDVPVKWSCRTGVCHTCESPLIGGTITYRPEPLDLPAQGSVLICCAQPKGDTELDL